MNVLDLLAQNQNQGTPTLAGAGENKYLSTTNSIIDLFGKAADVVNTAKDGFKGRTTDTSGATQSVPGQTAPQAAKSFLSKYGLYISIGLGLLGVFLVLRRR